jgi:hypothetical protein
LAGRRRGQKEQRNPETQGNGQCAPQGRAFQLFILAGLGVGRQGQGAYTQTEGIPQGHQPAQERDLNKPAFIDAAQGLRVENDLATGRSHRNRDALGASHHDAFD